VLGALGILDKSYFAKTLLFTITTLGFCLILLGGMHSNFQINNYLLVALIRKISMYSYSMYLSHLTLLQLVKTNVSNPIYGLFIWLTLTFAISAFVYEFFEKVILNYRDNKFPSLNGPRS
jgi:peptidoglycan/LPS O-acetylase OafA/YrhL